MNEAIAIVCVGTTALAYWRGTFELYALAALCWVGFGVVRLAETPADHTWGLIAFAFALAIVFSGIRTLTLRGQRRRRSMSYEEYRQYLLRMFPSRWRVKVRR